MMRWASERMCIVHCITRMTIGPNALLQDVSEIGVLKLPVSNEAQSREEPGRTSVQSSIPASAPRFSSMTPPEALSRRLLS